MKLLLLGGPFFLGRALIDAALERGHDVTAFNRGNHPLPPNVELIRGDRNAPELPEDRSWDAVIDTSGQTPRQVRRTAKMLRGRVDAYAYISSISVYPFPIAPGIDESEPVAAMPRSADPDDAHDTDHYGARKAACEAALEAVLGERVLIVRPGFIVGPHDYTNRFNVWVEAAARPLPLVVPDDGAQPVQLIDVRDLAAWIVALLERGVTGVYNATGPGVPLTLLEMVQACVAGAGGTARILTLPAPQLRARGIEPWEHLPFWCEPEHAGMMQVGIARARAAGLTFRPLDETARDTHAWLRRHR